MEINANLLLLMNVKKKKVGIDGDIHHGVQTLNIKTGIKKKNYFHMKYMAHIFILSKCI